MSNEHVSLGLAATFTAEPIEGALEFWWKEIGTPVDVRIAPYQQVFQQVLDPGSVLGRSALNVLLVRWEDWARDLHDRGALERCAADFARALGSVAKPTLVVLCHPSPAATSALGAGFLAKLDTTLAAAVGDAGLVTVVDPGELDRLYRVDRPHDPYGARAGAVPYVPRYYTALATRIARQVARWRWLPPKVIVLDCDDTLWRGTCAELGPDGVVPAVELQRFLARRAEAGTLLCLCSRNEPADVYAVFARHPAMPLRLEHFVAERINWLPKGENVRALAEELDQPLDRIVVVDDDPVQCAAIREACPDVLTVRVPADGTPARQVLDHLWPLDLRPVTEEDRRRTTSYREERARKEARASAPSLAGFLATLELEVELQPLDGQHAERVAQLTERTTQFNTTGRRLSHHELREGLASGELAGAIAHVRDRFGDYGLVGAVVYRHGPELAVEAFLLSCRALGRGVEHRMLSHVGWLARTAVRLPFVPTARNAPARAFLEAVAGRWGRADGDGAVFEIPAADARAVAFEPGSGAPAPAAESAPTAARAAAPDWTRIANELARPEDVHERVLAFHRRERPGVALEPARTPTEEVMVSLWATAFGLDRVGRSDDFFDLGGHSLLATQVMSAVWSAFGVELPLATIFSARTPAALAEAVDRVRVDERAVATLPAVKAAPEDRHLPFALSPLQQASWLGRTSAFVLGNVGSHSYIEIDCEGLDLERYRDAWRATIAQHDMLRAVVLPEGLLKVLPAVPPFEIPEVDLRGWPAAEAEAALRTRRDALSDRTLRPDRWPAFEVRATRLDSSRMRLHLSFDGMMYDQASQQMILDEVARRYENPEAAFPALQFTYRDYRAGERACDGTPRWRRAREYWLARLDSLPPAPELPLARAPESITRPRFVRRSARVPATAWNRLQREAAVRSITGSSVLLAAFAEVLATWSRSPRFTLNLTTFNRKPFHPQVAALVGSFTSLSLLEVDGSGPGFAGRAASLQDRLWRDLDHREVQGTEVLREMTRARGAVVTMPVVFTSMLALRHTTGPAVPDGVRGRRVFAAAQTPQIWLENTVREEDGELVLDWDAVDELFEDGVLDAMFGAYVRLVHELAGAPDAWSRERFDLVPRADLEQRARVNATGVPVPEVLLNDLFAAQAEARPAAEAVVAGDTRLTYGDLARLARQLGRRLRADGVGRGSLVAMSMEPGWEQVVAVLGILEAGGAYLPLDPALPVERRASVLEAAGVELVLTQRGTELAWPAGVRTLAVSAGELASLDAAPLERVQSPGDLAYVIYTSGSTGRPKGVMIDHRGAVNTILDVNRRIGAGPKDRVLAISSMSFDLSVYDVFGLLAAGGTIVMKPPAAHPDPARWIEVMARERVTIWNSVPALLELVLEHGGGGRPLPTSLKTVMLSGDWIPTSLPDAIRAHAPGARVIAMGGATEASIWSIWHEIGQVDPRLASIPYGVPMDNQSWQVLDERLAPRPVWVPGPLYIGGRGVALGYLGDAELTARRFIAHPATGERLYDTGDVGRYRPDGTIELLGREDLQVKIRGHRIELGEIESVLREHPSVRAAVAVALGQPRRARQLVAFVTLAEPGLDPDELLELAARKLPDYMVPATCRVIDAVPLTPNGKVDRGALAQLASRVPAEERPAVSAPASPLAARFTELVAEILELPAVDPAEGFLAQGGDSLRGMRLIARIRDNFGAEMPLDLIFGDASVLEMAGEVERRAQVPVTEM